MSFEHHKASTPDASSWEHFEHQADIGVRGLSYTLAGAFEQAALAMIGGITDPKAVVCRRQIELSCEAPDVELLLTEWLNLLVYEMAVRKMLFGCFELMIKDNHLKAKIWGEPINRRRHQPAVEIKGATFTELKVAQQPDGRWLAQCVVDA